MTEEVWKLSKENAELRKSLAQVQVQLLQFHFEKAKAESEALGETWVDAGISK